MTLTKSNVKLSEDKPNWNVRMDTQGSFMFCLICMMNIRNNAMLAQNNWKETLYFPLCQFFSSWTKKTKHTNIQKYKQILSVYETAHIFSVVKKKAAFHKQLSQEATPFPEVHACTITPYLMTHSMSGKVQAVQMWVYDQIRISNYDDFLTKQLIETFCCRSREGGYQTLF